MQKNRMKKKSGRRSQRGRLAGLSAVVCLGILPLPASSFPSSAAGSSLAAGIWEPVGAASLVQSSLSREEYLALARAAKGALWGYTNLGIADVESGNLNIRAVPSTDGKLVGKLPKNAACELRAVRDGWAYIQSGEVEGYVNLDFLLTGPQAKLRADELVETVVRVNGDGLRVRDSAGLDSGVLTQVPAGEELEFVERLGGWVKVSIDGEDGYVSAEHVTVEEKLETAVTMTELLYGQGVSDVRVDLVEYAKQFLGNPYRWGGTSLTKGADCSGFVLSVFQHFGIRLSHSSKAQAGEGARIGIADLKPGDLVFYANSSGSVNHVAIYIGGGQVIHASSPRTGIKISKYHYRTPVKAVRILQD
ncbi:MAG: C40 family peptidase [Clostridium sp.]|jgi:hypothetical protein|nr:C40 family peptidase [Clostridium sp.]